MAIPKHRFSHMAKEPPSSFPFLFRRLSGGLRAKACASGPDHRDCLGEVNLKRTSSRFRARSSGG
jgi:hypothetical protein